ncbi:hypothetical protein BaRGS_00002682 [Batillaria attramentaria]|uniref:Uncharacterized protein n=1 Tax=Batillaria attramentaria TaxID=370345 RepID=A0ABD0M2I6_9CAEN
MQNAQEGRESRFLSVPDSPLPSEGSSRTASVTQINPVHEPLQKRHASASDLSLVHAKKVRRKLGVKALCDDAIQTGNEGEIQTPPGIDIILPTMGGSRV